MPTVGEVLTSERDGTRFVVVGIDNTTFEDGQHIVVTKAPEQGPKMSAPKPKPVKLSIRKRGR